MYIIFYICYIMYILYMTGGGGRAYYIDMRTSIYIYIYILVTYLFSSDCLVGSKKPSEMIWPNHLIISPYLHVCNRGGLMYNRGVMVSFLDLHPPSVHLFKVQNVRVQYLGTTPLVHF